MECPKCKNEISEDLVVCPYCKKVLKLVCPKCKTVNKSNTCQKCGFVIITRCHQCEKVVQTIKEKCPKCGFSTYTSVAINSSNIDEFALLTVEFPNVSDLKQVLGSIKLAEKFRKNLNSLVTNYAASAGITREIIDDVYILRFNKDASLKISAKNAVKGAIEILNQITEINFKLNKFKNITLQCKMAILKRDIYSPPDAYQSGFDVKMIYTNKASFKLLNCLQAITDSAIYEIVSNDFELSTLSSTFVKGQMVMFFELNLKKYVKIPVEKPKEEATENKRVKSKLVGRVEDFEEDNDEYFVDEVEEISFEEMKCKFSKTKSINLIPEVIKTLTEQRNQIIAVRGKREFIPRADDFVQEINASGIFDNVLRINCFEDMKYQPYGFFYQLLSIIFNYRQSPKYYEDNNFDIFKNLDESGFIKSLVNFETRTFPNPDDIRYSLYDLFLNVIEGLPNILIYIENFDKIDETSFEILQLAFQNLNKLNVSFLTVSDNDYYLHKKSFFLINLPEYTEISVKPTPIKEFFDKDSSIYKNVMDNFYVKSIIDNTMGSFLYFENAMDYLKENNILVLDENKAYSINEGIEVYLPVNLKDLLEKRLNTLYKKDENAYNLLCKLLLIGPFFDMASISLFNIPKANEAIKLLEENRYIDIIGDIIYLKNYSLLKRNILNDFEKEKLSEIAAEIEMNIYGEAKIHPCETFLYNLQQSSKNEFLVWENLCNQSYSMGDFSSYLNCSMKLLKHLENYVNESSEKTVDDYKIEIYENLSNLLYKYSPNKIFNISKTILENLEKATDDKKVINMCNKMLQGCLIGGNYSHALDLTRKILSRFSNISMNPSAENFNVSYFLISLVKIEVLFSVGNLKDCVEAGDEILNVLTPESIQQLKPENLSIAHFESTIFDAMNFVVISKIMLLEKEEQISAFLEKIQLKIGKIPQSFDMYLTLQKLIKGFPVEPFEGTDSSDKFALIVSSIIKAFVNYSDDYKSFANAVYQAKIKAKMNKLSQIELSCDLLIGYSYFKLNSFKKAESIFYNILDISTKNGLNFVTYLDWYLISLLKFEQKEYDTALGIASNAIVQLEKDNTCGDFLFYLFRILLAHIYNIKNNRDVLRLCVNNAKFLKEKYSLNTDFGLKELEEITNTEVQEIIQPPEQIENSEISENTGSIESQGNTEEVSTVNTENTGETK